MTTHAVRFAGCAAAACTAAALAAWPAARAYGADVPGWALAGWLTTTAIGVAGGCSAVARHGSAGAGFLVAVGVCMLARLVALGIGVAAAASRGGGAVAAYLVGLAAGYLPAQATEVIWLLRAGRRS